MFTLPVQNIINDIGAMVLGWVAIVLVVLVLRRIPWRCLRYGLLTYVLVGAILTSVIFPWSWTWKQQPGVRPTPLNDGVLAFGVYTAVWPLMVPMAIVMK